MSDNLPPLPEPDHVDDGAPDTGFWGEPAMYAYAREAVRIAKAEKGLEPVARESFACPICQGRCYEMWSCEKCESVFQDEQQNAAMLAHPPTQVEPVPDYSEAEFAASALRGLDWLDKPLLNGVADLLLRQAYAIAHPPTQVEPVASPDVQAFVDSLPRPKDRLQEYADAFAVQAINAYLAHPPTSEWNDAIEAAVKLLRDGWYRTQLDLEHAIRGLKREPR